MRNFIKGKLREIKNILKKVKRRDFSDNEGLAIKNSSWSIAATLVSRIGALFFSIIMARLMLPEIYGLYGLALSTILFLGIFSDLGINPALMTFISNTIDKNKKKAKGYFIFLTKYKILLMILSFIIFLLISKWLAVSYYKKPIYYALLAGIIYLPMIAFSTHLNSIFASKNNFKPQFIREVIVQSSRLLLIPLSIIYFLSKISSIEVYLLWIFILLSFCYMLGSVYFIIIAKRKDPFENCVASRLNKDDKINTFKFMIPLAATALSGMLFGHIDQIMLGPKVAGQFLGFYQAAFSLITSAAAIISFSAAAVFPIFARLKGDQLERGFKKTRKITLLISVLAAVVIFMTASFVIKIYGVEFAAATNYLRALSLLLISFPLIGLYTTYYTSQKKTKIVSILLILSTVLNIILNYVFITIGLRYSMSYAVLGVCAATIISRYLYLGGLILWRRR